MIEDDNPGAGATGSCAQESDNASAASKGQKRRDTGQGKRSQAHRSVAPVWIASVGPLCWLKPLIHVGEADGGIDAERKLHAREEP